MKTLIQTKKEGMLLNNALHNAGSNFSFFNRELDHGYEIAAVRLMIEQGERSSSLSSPSSRATVTQYRILLCKLLEMYPDVAQEYVIQRDISPFVKDTRIARLLSGYRKYINTNGIGMWSIRQHEGVISGIYGVNDGMASVFFAPRSAIASLFTAYTTQAAAVVPVAQASKTVRSAFADEILQGSTTSVERKQTARDAQGSCYVCASPKPRQVVCSVCGYRPRGGV